jgi:hypothetical protein
MQRKHSFFLILQKNIKIYINKQTDKKAKDPQIIQDPFFYE